MINNSQFKKSLDLKTWRPYLLIFIIGFLLYGQTLFYNLSYLDDNTLILDQEEILTDYKKIPTIFSSDAFFSGTNFYYRPLLNLSFMIDAQFSGFNYFIYHLDNILLHLIATSLIFYLLYLLTRRKSLAFFLALIFLVHPALTQAVAWLPGRNDSLLTIFILAAVLSLISFSKRPKLFSLLLYTFFFFLALLTKETAILFPILILVYFLSIGRRDQAKNTDRILVFAFSFLAGFIWLIMRSLAFSNENIGIFSAARSIINNLPDALVMAGKIIFPFNLSVLPVSADSTLIYGLITLVFLSIILIFSRHKRYDYLFFGIVWFLVFFFPPFAISNSAPYFLEHRLYLPMVGFLIVLSEIDFIKNLNFKKKKVGVGSVVILIILSGITFYHSQNFKNRLVFWQSAVRTSPHSPLAQKNLGVMYYFNGDYFQAVKHYNLALNINPQEIMVHNNLGVIYMNQKKYQLAKQEFNAELKNNPGYDKALANLQDLSSRQK